MRACVYVDGFNVYYRALRGTPFKWLNYAELARLLLDPNDTVERVHYFTARVSSRSGDRDAPRRQQIYFNALGTLPNVTFHMGRFIAKTKWRPLVSNSLKFVEIHDTEEKGSDVNLAVHLLNDGWRGRYDIALVMTQDTDLIESLKIVRQELRKTVGLVWLDGRRADWRMAAAASFTRHLAPAELRAAQFPNPVIGPGGTQIFKPATW